MKTILSEKILKLKLQQLDQVKIQKADKCGGVYVDTEATIHLDGGSITGNSATGEYTAGGGLYWQDATINGTGTNVTENSQDNYYPERH